MSEAPLWQDSGVTLLRNRQTGAVIELVARFLMSEASLYQAVSHE